MIKAVIYTRVSTEEQTHGYSLENQKEQCIKKAIELGAKDWTVYEEAGVSGEVANRPQLLDAVDAARIDKDVKYFVCYDPDRFSRDLALLLAFTSQIEKSKRVQLVYVNFQRDDTPEGVFMYQVRGAVAQLEKELIKRRTTIGRIEKARKGGWTHWPGLFGYNYHKDVVEVNEKQAEVIRLIFSLAAEMGVKNIADRLALMGLESPRAGSVVWSHTTVRRIVANETYYSGKTHIRTTDSSKTHLNKWAAEEDKIKRKFRPRDEWIEMSVPPIIDEETFLRAKRKLDVARRQSAANVTERFLLSGLLRCGACGKTWHGFSTVRGPKRATYYVCTYKSPGPPKGTDMIKCDTNFVQAQKFEETIWKVIKGWLENDKEIELFHTSQRSKRPKPKPSSELELLRMRFEQLNKEEDNMIGLYRKEINTRIREKLQSELSAISLELDKVKHTIDELEGPAEELAVAEVNMNLVQKIRSEYQDLESMGWEERYKAIHALVKSIKVVQSEGHYRLEIAPFR